MGTKILRDEFGELTIEKLSNDLKRVTIKQSKRIYCPDSEIVTKSLKSKSKSVVFLTGKNRFRGTIKACDLAND